MKYAKIERERCFLLKGLPPELDPGGTFLRIVDRYIIDTRMRLRRMESATGEVIDRKLTQKFVDVGNDLSRTTITNFYLNEVEYTKLLALDALVLTKRRYPYLYNEKRHSIDVFENALTGLILAEIEFASDEEMHKREAPDFALCEVTTEPFFAGGNLVTVSAEGLQRVLIERGITADL